MRLYLGFAINCCNELLINYLGVRYYSLTVKKLGILGGDLAWFY